MPSSSKEKRMETEPLKHLHFEQHLTLEDDLAHLNVKIAALLLDMTDEAITDAIVEAAKNEGITDLYLLDKQFVMEAIKEKMEREQTPTKGAKI